MTCTAMTIEQQDSPLLRSSPIGEVACACTPPCIMLYAFLSDIDYIRHVTCYTSRHRCFR